MSRIGKKIIEIPENVSIEVKDKKILVKGKHGVLEQFLTDGIEIESKENKLFPPDIFVSFKPKSIRIYGNN